jgi:hypothetical protein
MRKVGKFCELAPAEVSDLFHTVQKVEKFIMDYYGVASFTITIQG